MGRARARIRSGKDLEARGWAGSTTRMGRETHKLEMPDGRFASITKETQNRFMVHIARGADDGNPMHGPVTTLNAAHSWVERIMPTLTPIAPGHAARVFAQRDQLWGNIQAAKKARDWEAFDKAHEALEAFNARPEHQHLRRPGSEF